MSFVQRFRFLFLLTAANGKHRVAAVERFPGVHHSADCIFIVCGIIQHILGYSENRIPLT